MFISHEGGLCRFCLGTSLALVLFSSVTSARWPFFSGGVGGETKYNKRRGLAFWRWGGVPPLPKKHVQGDRYIEEKHGGQRTSRAASTKNV